MKLRDLSPQDNDKENVAKILQPKENEESENMKSITLQKNIKLMQSLTDSSIKPNTAEINIMEKYLLR